jgi:hypothetical protein
MSLPARLCAGKPTRSAVRTYVNETPATSAGIPTPFGKSFTTPSDTPPARPGAASDHLGKITRFIKIVIISCQLALDSFAGRAQKKVYQTVRCG